MKKKILFVVAPVAIIFAAFGYLYYRYQEFKKAMKGFSLGDEDI